jgi:hypothetical protein
MCAPRPGRRCFPASYYIEVQRPSGADGAAAAEVLVAASADLAARLGLPLVATHPVQFLQRDDYKAHEARVCIADGYVLGDNRRPKRFSPEQYFKTTAEMVELFADLPEALRNSVEIARRCNLSVELGKSRLPDFPTPAGEPLEAFLASESHAGLVRRLELLYPDAAEREKQRPTYVARLDFEIATIVKMGFPGYFLIVADFINWAKANGVPVGPGRGSGAGSLVAYSLGITDLDPLRYDLLFERFLNPGARVDARLRHRLLPGRPRPRHRLRQEEIRRACRVADRHLRHHGGQGGHPRRRSRARPRLQLRRPVRQADPQRAGHYAQRRAGQGAGDPPDASRPRRRSPNSGRWRSSSKASRATSACMPAAC